MDRENLTILVITSDGRGVKSVSAKLSHVKLFLVMLLVLSLVSVISLGFAYSFFREAQVHDKETFDAVSQFSILTEHSITNDVTKKKLDKKLKHIEDQLLDLQRTLKKKGIKKELSLGGGFEAPDRATMSYIDFLSHDIDEMNDILKNTPIGVPIPGKLNAGFGYRKDPLNSKVAFHSGVDIDAKMGDPVRTTAAGTVIHAGWYHSLGKTVKLKHQNGFITVYGHLSKIKVINGQKVSEGDLIGNVGSTGRSTGPHLHYEILKEKKKVNPKKYMSLR